MALRPLDPLKTVRARGRRAKEGKRYAGGGAFEGAGRQ